MHIKNAWQTSTIPPNFCIVFVSFGLVQFWNCFRLKTFKTSLFNVFKTEHAQSLTVDRIREFVNEENREDKFGDAELFAAIDKMQDDNQIMLSENIVFLIWGQQ